MKALAHHRESLRRYLIWCVVIASALALFLAFGPKRDQRPTPGREPAPKQRSGYVNRARWSIPRDEAAAAIPPMPAITGTVYDRAGAPLAGATLTATTFEVAGNFPTVAGSTTSDERGRFALRVRDGSYNLVGDKEGYGPTLVIAHSGEEIGVVLAKSGVVVGRVLDERRAPVTHFTIDVLTTAPETMAAPAPLLSKRFDSPDGSFHIDRLPAWPVILRATAADHAPAFSPFVAVGPDQRQELDLTLPSGCTLTGTVKDANGAPLPHVFLDAETSPSAGMTSNGSMDAASQTESDLEGRFRLERVPPGEVAIRGYDGRHAATTIRVHVSACDRLEPVDVVMSAGGSVTGVVHGSDGKPLAGARLTATQRSIGFVNTETDTDGRYRFDRLPAGPVRLELQGVEQRTVVHVNVKEGQIIERDVALFAPGKGEIRGRVTAGDKPLKGIQVTVVCNQAPAGMDARYVLTGDDGTYRATGLPDGNYLVMASSAVRAGTGHVEDGSRDTVDLDVAEKPTPTAALISDDPAE